jgi:aryl-alcohol dehydrogenase-like predicted oxidoreductase
MQYRSFSTAGWNVSRIGFGAWAVGADWGHVSEDDAMAALHAAFERGVNFIDTADVYGDGRSERLAARLRKERPRDDVYIATKAGRRLDPHVADGYNRENLTAFVDRSLTNLDTETIDLVQLHCPPTDVYYRPEVFDIMDDLVAAGKIRHYGVSVEKVEEAVKALEYPGVKSVQIIFNMFRQRPAERFFARAQEQNVAILARVPLASGLLTGKMSAASSFAADDHRNYNRSGAAFDVGETFAGVPFEVGLTAVERLRELVPGGATMAMFALRWVLMFDGVTLAIPGAKNPEQAVDNAAAADLVSIDDATMSAVQSVYDELIKPHVHQRW